MSGWPHLVLTLVYASKSVSVESITNHELNMSGCYIYKHFFGFCVLVLAGRSVINTVLVVYEGEIVGNPTGLDAIVCRIQTCYIRTLLHELVVVFSRAKGE